MTGKAFVDTNIYIYALTQSKDPRDERKSIIAHAVFETLVQSQTIVTSTQVLNEFHSNLVKKFKLEDALVFNIVEQNILPISLVEPIGFQTYCSAYRLRTEYSLSFWDSLIVASALENQCATLYSEDMQHRLNIEGKLLIINPFIWIVGEPLFVARHFNAGDVNGFVQGLLWVALVYWFLPPRGTGFAIPSQTF